MEKENLMVLVFLSIGIVFTAAMLSVFIPIVRESLKEKRPDESKIPSSGPKSN